LLGTVGSAHVGDIFQGGGDIGKGQAGQTGGGKSTFLRQMITTLYLKNEKMDFILIDLKGGLEFQLFGL
jgi:hypothetical protein